MNDIRTERPARSPDQVLPEALRELRRRRGWTQQELADAVESLGGLIERPKISNVESGKRKASLDELFCLAVALGVSPEALVLPRSDPSVKVTPSRTERTERVVYWWRNFFPLTEPRGIEPLHPRSGWFKEDRFFDESRTDSEVRAFETFPQLRRLVEKVALAVEAAASNDPEDSEDFRELMTSIAYDAKAMAEAPNAPTRRSFGRAQEEDQ